MTDAREHRDAPRTPKGLLGWAVSDRVVIPVIALNALAIACGLEGEGPLAQALKWFDYACVVFFVFEAVIKIQRRGWTSYWSDPWNRFDFVIVAVSSPLLIGPFFSLNNDFIVLSALRMGRLFRLFRILRFIPNRDHLVNGVRRALKASLGVFLALALLNAILSVGAYSLFHQWDSEHFGSPLRAMYTMFKVFTIEGWFEIPDAIALAAAEAGAPAYWTLIARGYFAFAVFCGGVLGVSIANAVFVDEMVSDNTEDLEIKVESMRQELRRLCELLERR